MSKNDSIGELIAAKVRLHNYRYPTSGHKSGDYACVIFEILDVLEGEIRGDCCDSNGNIAVAGEMPHVDKDTEYTLRARLINHKRYGLQYECESLTLGYDMSDPEDQRKFFSYFLTENQINALFAAYDDPAAILDGKDMDKLTAIKGVGPVTAARMIEKYSDNKSNGRAYVQLKEYGLTKHAIDKLIEQFGSPDLVVEIITQNPYALIKLARGYGWRKADALALSRGMRRDCKERCLAYAHYFLEQFADREGNSCVSVGELLNNTCAECAPATRENVAAWIKEDMACEEEFEVLYLHKLAGAKGVDFPDFYYSKETQKIGLFSLRMLERLILDHLKRLKGARSSFNYDRSVCESIIAEVEAEQGYEYTHEQKSAIWKILDNNVSILTGSSGTGKSSTLKPLIRIFQYYGQEVEQCALSGRAASLLTEYTGLVGKTIHRLLRYLPEKEMFACDEKHPLTADVVILDETSMVGEDLFISLIEAIRSGAKLVMLGDVKQLPPLSVGNVLGDMIRSGYIPTTTLTIIQRQARDSGIISEAARVCEGKAIVKNGFVGEEVRGNLRDFKLVSHLDQTTVHTQTIEEFKKLFIGQSIPSDDIQIIVPKRVGGLNSCRQFNAEIQALANGKATKKDVTVEMREKDVSYCVTYRPGDRVMITKNNYHARTLDGDEVAVFNGNMGHITSLTPGAMVINLDDQGKVILPRDDWGGVQHCWACTAHKCQGSQFKYAIVVLDKGSYTMLSREWLYTAMTRAKRYCVLIGQPDAINTATRTSNIKIKQTWLKNDLAEAFLEERRED